MSIKQTKNSVQNNSVNILDSRIENLFGDRYLQNLPDSIKQKMRAFQNELRQYKSNKNDIQYKEISGEVLDSDSILNIIIEATGYNKWKLDDTEELEQSEIQELKDEYGICFSDDNISKYYFTRNTNDRNALSRIIVVALPNYYHVGLETDRAGYFLDDLVTASEFKKFLEDES